MVSGAFKRKLFSMRWLDTCACTAKASNVPHKNQPIFLIMNVIVSKAIEATC
jgi:hypothetical protein